MVENERQRKQKLMTMNKNTEIIISNKRPMRRTKKLNKLAFRKSCYFWEKFSCKININSNACKAIRKKILKNFIWLKWCSRYKNLELVILMSSYYLNAYEPLSDYPDKITNTKIAKVSYLLKLKAQCNSISNLDSKHKIWGQINHT